MRTRFDQFSKDVLADCLKEAGEVETERETKPEVQKVDVWFHPWPQAGRRWFHDKPVLATIVQSAALLEPFHQTPSVVELLSCVGKQQTVFREIRRKNKTAAMPTTWIVSSGRPRAAIRQLGFSPMPDIARGVYTAPPGFRLRLVAVSELPKTRLLPMARKRRSLVDCASGDRWS